MTDDDGSAFAELWLSEMGAWVPEHRDGAALAPRVRRYGLDLTPHERAGASSDALRAEPLRAHAHRARSDPRGRA